MKMRRAVTMAGSRDAGFTMVEVMIALMILVVAIMGLLASIIPATRLMSVNRETTIAMGTAMGVIEYMSDPGHFSELFATYNEMKSDDPGGVGTANGVNFDVPTLRPLAGDTDGMVGRIIFPVLTIVDAGSPDGFREELREDVLDSELQGLGIAEELGMPRDLDGDGVAGDSDNHASDYYLLPVTIRLEWHGVAGPRSLQMSTLIAER